MEQTKRKLPDLQNAVRHHKPICLGICYVFHLSDIILLGGERRQGGGPWGGQCGSCSVSILLTAVVLGGASLLDEGCQGQLCVSL